MANSIQGNSHQAISWFLNSISTSQRVMERKVKSLSRVRLFVTPWTAASQAPPSMVFSRQEYWSGLPFPFQMMKGNNLQPRILYPARLSFIFDREIKSFPDQQKLREFSTTKLVLQQMLKQILKAENTREGKDLQ